ncbi:BQ5605_C031g10963 [Microbotryum silenes-dioicae]|uniref:BQ5605_C031g10963 protein n=1 Tax=Microbotryum silenes-dioicae TaxID=796604 RepID=A0A2X0MLE6_9BASI|nr:BQ5605_C031g10963 [Microbotryum silenes-dioicae]
MFWTCLCTLKHGFCIAFTYCFSVAGCIILLTVHNSQASLLRVVPHLLPPVRLTAGPIFLTALEASSMLRAITSALIPGIGT